MIAFMVGVGIGMSIAAFQQNKHALGGIIVFMTFLLFLYTKIGKFLREKISKLLS